MNNMVIIVVSSVVSFSTLCEFGHAEYSDH
jgi:hypothetical protein